MDQHGPHRPASAPAAQTCRAKARGCPVVDVSGVIAWKLQKISYRNEPSRRPTGSAQDHSLPNAESAGMQKGRQAGASFLPAPQLSQFNSLPVRQGKHSKSPCRWFISLQQSENRHGKQPKFSGPGDGRRTVLIREYSTVIQGGGKHQSPNRFPRPPRIDPSPVRAAPVALARIRSARRANGRLCSQTVP